ncbi:N-acetylmuramoyl-L-alanine amidase [Rubrobacter calidifluminis]|uniref:N-acetylmuramoyl-L-alanine amidase n=1 Tax=Rubrobacter calidifluminis TaxID=1392640 RepID=UPI00235EC789|nr:N-acetylmuramoyl-L-alanine amidase [Rubrobacter calidifluminis]
MCLECGAGISRERFLRLGAAGIGSLGLLGLTGGEAWAGGIGLREVFRVAARRYGVPEELLLAMGYVNSMWEMPPRRFGRYRPGDVHGMGGYGVMGLRQDPRVKTLAEASRLTGFSRFSLETEPRANIIGAAAVLSKLAGKKAGFGRWYRVVGEYGGGRLYADEVYAVLGQGVSARVGGRSLSLAAVPAARAFGDLYQGQAAGDYPGSTWYGASPSNYTAANRPNGGLNITTIVVHVTQGSWASAIDWFSDPRAQVSAHYVVRRSDGKIGQCVHEHDIAWHAGNWSYNQHSIGIEHEGYADNPGNWTDAMLRSSARLTAHLCRRYGIPIDRDHIIGHNQVPGSTHYCPGPYFPFERYISLVRSYASAGTGSSQGKVTYQQIVDNTSSRFRASSNWGYSHWSSQRYGGDYRYASPKAVSDSAEFRVKVPETAAYDIYARWPADPAYNSATPFGVVTTSGIRWVHVDQRRNGGRWLHLGRFRMKQGNARRVLVSRWTSSEGIVVADAVMIRRYG